MTTLTEDFDVVIRSHRLHARRFGPPDAPLTLAVHGVSLNSKTFDYLGERLGDADIQLVALDLRGRGRSQSTSPGTYGWENHARDLFAIADHLGFDRFSLIGQSMGGSVAMKAAELNGSRIDRMVLVDVAGRVDRGFGTLVGSLIADARSPYRSPEEYVETIRASGLISPWNEYWERCYRYGLVSSNQRFYVRTDPKAVEEDRAYGRAQDPYERWTFLTMPVLLLRAVEELHPGTGFAVPRDDVDLFLQRVPLAQLSEIDANHLTINTHPDTVKEVVGFLAI